MSVILPVICGGSLVSRRPWTDGVTHSVSIPKPDFSSDDDECKDRSIQSCAKLPITGSMHKRTHQLDSLKELVREASENFQFKQLTMTRAAQAANMNSRNASMSPIETGNSEVKSIRLDSFNIFAIADVESNDTESSSFLQYEKVKRLGQGASGTVWRALYQGKDVAVKEIYLNFGDIHYEYKMKKIIEEFEAHKRLEHPNIIKFYDGEIQRDLIVFITEYMKHGSLGQHIRRNGPLDEKMVRQTIYQVIQGLAYVHSKDIIHRDIKADNILIADDGQSVKIADFGVSVSKDDSNHITNSNYLNGSYHWMAPEFFFQAHYDAKVDTWSVGCLALELITGRVPFIDQAKDVFSLSYLFKKMESGYFPIQNPLETIDVSQSKTCKKVNISHILMNFFQKVFQLNPENRHTCTEILENIDQYPWLTEDLYISNSSNDSYFTNDEEDSNQM